MKARLFGTIALVMLPTLAFAADAGAPTSSATAPDNAKAAGTGGGEVPLAPARRRAVIMAAQAMLEPTEQPRPLRRRQGTRPGQTTRNRRALGAAKVPRPSLKRRHNQRPPILPEDIDWKPFVAFPPSVRLAVLVGQPSEPAPM
jgi:hypothetical protein